MTYRNHWTMWAQWQPETQAHQFVMTRESGDQRSMVTIMELTDLPRRQVTRLDQQAVPGDQVESFLQAALDCAWDLGLRPKGAKDMTNELAAVRYHLEDMRKLAKVNKS